MEEFEKLQKVLETDSKDGLVGLAVDRIKELQDAVSKKEAEISELKSKLDSEKESEKDEKEDEEKDAEKKEEADDKVNEEVESLKKENDALKAKLAETEKKVDAVLSLKDSQEKTDKRVDSIARKIVRPLFNVDSDGIAELKAKRMNQYADSVKKFVGDQ